MLPATRVGMQIRRKWFHPGAAEDAPLVVLMMELGTRDGVGPVEAQVERGGGEHAERRGGEYSQSAVQSPADDRRAEGASRDSCSSPRDGASNLM